MWGIITIKNQSKWVLWTFYTPKTTQNGKNRYGKQTTINDAFKKELREKACVDIAKWLSEAVISFNTIKFNSFRATFESISRYRLGMKPPSYYDVRVPLLKIEVAHMDDIMRNHKEE